MRPSPPLVLAEEREKLDQNPTGQDKVVLEDATSHGARRCSTSAPTMAVGSASGDSSGARGAGAAKRSRTLWVALPSFLCGAAAVDPNPYACSLYPESYTLHPSSVGICLGHNGSSARL